MLAIDVQCTPSDVNFCGKLAVLWMRQIFAMSVPLLFKPPIELLGAIALADGTFTALVHVRSLFMLGWVGYLTCIFGACTGVVVADFKSLMQY
ncbi:hypothetical protein [Burkholderia sp. THE68]|uniref:hypothetical protein n=1 Tax=Burkholderia sp. THE68 TaxID=758782 RepID=UPI001389FF2E|nr:hypothetical protein [Burkholderia sp. THE68]